MNRDLTATKSHTECRCCCVNDLGLVVIIACLSRNFFDRKIAKNIHCLRCFVLIIFYAWAKDIIIYI